jgi:hypothetical protein
MLTQKELAEKIQDANKAIASYGPDELRLRTLVAEDGLQ